MCLWQCHSRFVSRRCWNSKPSRARRRREAKCFRGLRISIKHISRENYLLAYFAARLLFITNWQSHFASFFLFVFVARQLCNPAPHLMAGVVAVVQDFHARHSLALHPEAIKLVGVLSLINRRTKSLLAARTESESESVQRFSIQPFFMSSIRNSLLHSAERMQIATH